MSEFMAVWQTESPPYFLLLATFGLLAVGFSSLSEVLLPSALQRAACLQAVHGTETFDTDRPPSGHRTWVESHIDVFGRIQCLNSLLDCGF